MYRLRTPEEVWVSTTGLICHWGGTHCPHTFICAKTKVKCVFGFVCILGAEVVKVVGETTQGGLSGYVRSDWNIMDCIPRIELIKAQRRDWPLCTSLVAGSTYFANMNIEDGVQPFWIETGNYRRDVWEEREGEREGDSERESEREGEEERDVPFMRVEGKR